MPPPLTTPQQQGLLRLLEFYFSDESFTYDAFLQSEADDAGAVPASTLAAFPKVASLLPEHTDEERRAAVLAVVALSDTIVLSGDDRIKRLFPLPADDPDAARSIALSGFRKGVPEAEVRAAIAAHARADDFGPIVSVRRLRDLQHSRGFSGICFVAFEDDAKGAVAAAAAVAGELRLPNGKPLQGMLLADHYVAQEEAIERKRQLRDEAKLPKGKVLRVDGLGADASRESLAELCAAHDVAYVDYSRGAGRGFVRFKTAAAASAALDGLRAAGEAAGGPSWALLAGEELETYWAAVQKKKEEAASLAPPASYGKGGGGGSGGGDGGKGKGKGKGGSSSAQPWSGGVVLRFEGVAAGTRRDELMGLCGAHGEVAYVDHHPNHTAGYVRFHRHDAARAALAALSAAPAPAAANGGEGGEGEGEAGGGGAPTWRLLDEAEEGEYRGQVQSRKRQRDEEGAGGRDATAAAAAAATATAVERGVVLRVEGAGGAADREALRALCSAHGEIAFIDFQRGDADGYVRFRAAPGATAALRALTAAPQDVGGAVPSWRALTEAEEDEYYDAVRRKRQHTDGKGGKGKGKGGKGKGGKGKGGKGGGGGISFGSRGRGRGW